VRFTVDSKAGVLITDDGELPLYGPEAFALLSRAWVRTGWALRYSYGFSWMGRPVIQLPEDLLRVQEVIHHVKPDVIIETGVAHGGSLIFYASLCEAAGNGRVVGIDIDIRADNRTAIEGHDLAHRIALIQGSSTDDSVLQAVREHIQPDDVVLVILDSNHCRAHVADELEAYADMVTEGSYIIATDGIMGDLSDVPGGDDEWTWDNPTQAAAIFVEQHSEFELCTPPQAFDETQGVQAVTYWPGAWLRRRVSVLAK
jgi:cephalosporin hydroxylase